MNSFLLISVLFTPLFLHKYLFFHVSLFFYLDIECGIIRKLAIFSSFKETEIYLQINSRANDSKINKNNNNIKNDFNSSTSFSWDFNQNKSYATILPKKSFSSHVSGDFLKSFLNIFPSEILSPHFIKYENSNDLSLLRKLGIRVIDEVEFYRNEFIPIISDLFHFYPAQTEKVIIRILEELKYIAEEDSQIVNLLKNTAFIPSDILPLGPGSNHGISTALGPNPGIFPIGFTVPSQNQVQVENQRKLYKPCELFDPENLELLTLQIGRASCRERVLMSV